MKAQLINTAMILSVLAINLSCSDKSGTTPIPVPEPSTEQAPSQPVSALNRLLPQTLPVIPALH
jgi:cytochrome c